MATFTSIDTSGYPTDYAHQEAIARRKRLQAKSQYDLGVADASTQATRALTDLSQKYFTGMEPQVTKFTGRGLGRSGIFQRAMKDYVTSQQRETGDVYQNLQNTLNQLAMGENQAGIDLQDELDRIARAKNEEILNAAAQLKAWAPYASLYGGG